MTKVAFSRSSFEIKILVLKTDGYGPSIKLVIWSLSANSHLGPNLDRAIADYRTALTIGGPKSAEASKKLFSVLVARGLRFQLRNIDQAIADFSEALNLDPLHHDVDLRSLRSYAFAHRGRAFEFKGDYKRALSDYDQASSREPGNKLAINGRNSVEQKMGMSSVLPIILPINQEPLPIIPPIKR